MCAADRRHDSGRAPVAPVVNFVEHPVLFDCEGERLVGIIAVPESAARVAVLVIVGGPQYRAGAHRQFVQLCAAARRRRLPGDALRLSRHGRQHGRRADVRGMRSGYRGRDRRAAVELSRRRARAFYGACAMPRPPPSTTGSRRRIARVAAMALLNPWVRSEDDAREGAHQALLRAAPRLEGILVEALLREASRRAKRFGRSCAPCGTRFRARNKLPAARRKCSRIGWPRRCGPFRGPCS